MDASLLPACFLLASFDGQSCGPAEIGKQYTIISNITSDIQKCKILWQIQAESVNTSVVLYDSSLPEPSVFPSLYNGTRKQLKILNVTKNDTTRDFVQVVNDIIVYTCTLPAYKRASTPTCEPLTPAGNQIRINCTTAQVYPQAKCQFLLQNGGIDEKNITDDMSYITYTHIDPQPEGNEYYSTSCTLQYPADGLILGNLTVQVNMYPNMAGVSLDQGTIGEALVSNPTPSELDKSPPIWAVVGGVIGAFILIVVVLGIIFIIRKKRNKRKHTSPGEEDNPNEDANLDELKRESLARESMGKPVPGAKPIPGAKPVAGAKPIPGAKPFPGAKPVLAVKPFHGAKPNVQDLYTTVNINRLQHSKNPVSDQSDDTTNVWGSGESPEIPKRLYNMDDLSDSVNEEPTSKDGNHTYSNEAVDLENDGNTYVNTGKV